MKLIFLIALIATQTFANEADTIMKSLYHANRPKTAVYKAKMIIEGSGRTSEREFVTIGQTNNIDDAENLVKFQKPSKFRNVSLLTKNFPNKNSSQWVYLPALKKVRRLDSSSKSGRFVGSDIYYTDLENRHYTKDNHTLVSQKGNLAVIESTPKEKDIYSKMVNTIDLEKMVITKSQFFIDGKPEKTTVSSDFKKDAGVWFAQKSVVTSHVIDQKTTTIITKHIFNSRVKKNYFNHFRLGDELKENF